MEQQDTRLLQCLLLTGYGQRDAAAIIVVSLPCIIGESVEVATRLRCEGGCVTNQKDFMG